MFEKLKKQSHRLKNFKAADKPRKAEKIYQPPGTKAQKAGMIFFWIIALFMLSVVAATIAANAGEDAAEEIEIKENIAMTPQAIDFAKRFAEVYFTWNPTAEGWTARETALAPMLADGIEENAGLVLQDQQWASRFGSATLAAMEEVTDNRSLITLEVTQELSRTVNEKKESKTIVHLFTVPVGFDKAYGILGLPSFTAVPLENQLAAPALDGSAVDSAIEANILNFLPTFFESYTTDTPDKLAYFLSGDPVQGLEGTKVLEEVQEAEVVAGTKEGTYEVAAQVLLRDPATDTGYLTNYLLTVEQSGDRYIVTKLNEGVE